MLAVFGAPLVQGPPPLAPEPASRLASVESSTSTQAERVDALAAQVAELEALAGALEPTVRDRVAAAVAEVPSRDGAALAALDERVGTVADELAALAAAAAGAVDPVPLLEAQDERLTALQDTLGELEARLSAESERLEAARAETTGALEEEVAAQTARLDTLNSDIATRFQDARDATGAAIADAQEALSGELAELRSRLDGAVAELETVKASLDELQQARGRAAAAALLAREIDRTIDTGAPFDDPLERLIAMSGDEAEMEASLATLRPYAAAGVPTITQLRADLAALAETAPAPAVAGYEWLGQTVDNITGLVTVRDRDTEADVATGRLAEADQALRDGDVATAIARVEEAAAMPDGVDPEAAEQWLADARARVSALAAQRQLDAHIRELLTATVN